VTEIPHFTVQNLTARVGGQVVLQDLSFRVDVGERLVLLGVNGCGKTTLLRLLDGLCFAEEGLIAFQGTRLNSQSLDNPMFRRRFRSEVALLFQNVDAMLFCPTVRAEIAFGPHQLGMKDAEERVLYFANFFGVTTLLDRPPFELSGGEKKRVALAALLAISPKVLLLDEPTAGLDPAWAGVLVDFLTGHPELTVFSSTHNLTLAEELGTRALLLGRDHSGFLFDGATADLVKNETLLVESGLAHRHRHRHQGTLHAHYHVHDTE
jgi:cobalt/nickel transport system ATP-binding protein